MEATFSEIRVILKIYYLYLITRLRYFDIVGLPTKKGLMTMFLFLLYSVLQMMSLIY